VGSNPTLSANHFWQAGRGGRASLAPPELTRSLGYPPRPARSAPKDGAA
jgi:hypothetical protein